MNYLYNAFLQQDSKNYNFDAIFYVDGKELFAHRDALASASLVFRELFIKHRPTPDNPVNQPIRIEKYTYDEFKEFIRMIYHVDDFDDDYPNTNKLFAVVELANIYQIIEIKQGAGIRLAKSGGIAQYRYHGMMSDDVIKDFYEKIEFAVKYSLNGFENVSKNVFVCVFPKLIEYNGFINLEKSVIKALAIYLGKLGKYIDKEEQLCKAIYKWGKHQAMVTVEMPEEESNELILHQIKDILPPLNIENMSNKFLFEFIVGKGLISVDKETARAITKVQITCRYKTIVALFIDYYDIYEFIGCQKKLNYNFAKHDYGYWNGKFEIPSKPSTVKERKDVAWYLLIEKEGILAVKHRSIIKKDDYLIAEMKSSTSFYYDVPGDDFVLYNCFDAEVTVSR